MASRAEVVCEGCGDTGVAVPPCVLPPAWGWVEVRKCWEGYASGNRKPGDIYVHALKRVCAGCLLDMRTAYRSRREAQRARRKSGEPSA